MSETSLRHVADHHMRHASLCLGHSLALIGRLRLLLNASQRSHHEPPDIEEFRRINELLIETNIHGWPNLQMRSLIEHCFIDQQSPQIIALFIQPHQSRQRLGVIELSKIFLAECSIICALSYMVALGHSDYIRRHYSLPGPANSLQSYEPDIFGKYLMSQGVLRIEIRLEISQRHFRQKCLLNSLK